MKGISRSGPITGGRPSPTTEESRSPARLPGEFGLRGIPPALPVAPMPGFHRPRLAAGMAYYSCSQPVGEQVVKRAKTTAGD